MPAIVQNGNAYGDSVGSASQISFNDSVAQLDADNVQGAIESISNKSCKSMGVQSKTIPKGGQSFDFNLNLDSYGTYLVCVRTDRGDRTYVGILIYSNVGETYPYNLHNIITTTYLTVKIVYVEGKGYLNITNNNTDWPVPVWVDVVKLSK